MGRRKIARANMGEVAGVDEYCSILKRHYGKG